MCKAKSYTEQLLDIYNNVTKDLDKYQEQLSQSDLYEQDILHIIENGGFNASEGYKLAKMICDSRQYRRRIKNELEPLMRLKNSFIDKNINSLNVTYNTIVRKENILNELSENKVYTPRILETTNIKSVVQSVINNQEKPLNMRYKPTNRQVIAYIDIDKDTIFVKFKDNSKNVIKKKDIVDFDETKKVSIF